MLDRIWPWFAGISLALCTLMVFLLISWAIADGLSDASGRVVDKYYDDQDLVCSKGCTIIPECWTIVVSPEPWWNDSTCVSESEYHSIDIGDYYTED